MLVFLEREVLVEVWFLRVNKVNEVLFWVACLGFCYGVVRIIIGYFFISLVGWIKWGRGGGGYGGEGILGYVYYVREV